MDYQVHELPVELAEDLDPCPQEPEQDIVVNAALLARIKVLESENVQLKRCLEGKKIIHSALNRSSMTIAFYTGFSSYIVFVFFSFLVQPSIS